MSSLRTAYIHMNNLTCFGFDCMEDGLCKALAHFTEHCMSSPGMHPPHISSHRTLHYSWASLSVFCVLDQPYLAMTLKHSRLFKLKKKYRKPHFHWSVQERTFPFGRLQLLKYDWLAFRSKVFSRFSMPSAWICEIKHVCKNGFTQQFVRTPLSACAEMEID